jgi:hypothetical protein
MTNVGSRQTHSDPEGVTQSQACTSHPRAKRQQPRIARRAPHTCVPGRPTTQLSLRGTPLPPNAPNNSGPGHDVDSGKPLSEERRDNVRRVTYFDTSFAATPLQPDRFAPVYVMLNGHHCRVGYRHEMPRRFRRRAQSGAQCLAEGELR